MSVAAVRVAANRALAASAAGALRTGGLHAELVVCLGASRKIAEALRLFGAGDACTDLLVAAFDARAGFAAGRVVGSPRPLAALDVPPPGTARAAAVAAAYKISGDELACGLEAAVITRLAAHDVAS